MEMSSKTQKNPSIRFKGFTDAWEQRKLGELCHIGDIDHRMPASVSVGIPYVMTGDFIGNNDIDFENAKRISEKDYEQLAKKIKPEKGDILFARYASVGTVRYVETNQKFLISYSCAILKPNEDIEGKYLYFYIQTGATQQRIELEINTGSQRNIGIDSLKNNIAVSVPKIGEQSKIGTFFKQLDDTIALHQRQLDNYKELKKSMLQKIFNQEVRFKDKNGNDYPDWKEIALKELGETFTGLSGKTKENFGKGKGKFVTYMNVFSNPIANLAMTENVEIKDGENQNEVCYGDIFFTTSSETPEEVGMSSVWLSHESDVYLNSFCFGYRLNTESEGKVIHQFLGIQLRAEHIRKKIVLLAQGSTRFNISKAKLIEIPVYLPTIQEQQKITDFLLIVEARIDQTTQKIEWMKEQKKGLMQRMFI